MADAKKAKAKKKDNVFKKIVSFFRSCIGEIKKISWPGVKPTTRNFGIVILFIVVAGLFIFGLDRGLYALLDLVMETANT
ncbi:MAG: preprotein translocase subunit SecE [Acutalibacteraceae bacterium]